MGAGHGARMLDLKEQHGNTRKPLDRLCESLILDPDQSLAALALLPCRCVSPDKVLGTVCIAMCMSGQGFIVKPMLPGPSMLRLCGACVQVRAPGRDVGHRARALSKGWHRALRVH